MSRAGIRQKKQPKNTFRIIAGRWRGRKVHFADGTDARPTGDRIRETLFNWLSPTIEGAACLDLFAGSGALGLEALSRDAGSLVFVEKDARLARALTDNLASLQCTTGQVYCELAERWLADHPQPFDIVFLDPPFRDQQLSKLCKLLNDISAVRDGGYCYLEMAADQSPPQLPAGWQVVRDKQAGRVRFQLIEVAINR